MLNSWQTILTSNLFRAYLAVLLSFVFTTMAQTQSAPPAQQEQEETEIRFKATYQIEEGTQNGWLVLSVELAPGSYIYSLTQQKNPPPSKIKVTESEHFSLLETFRPDREPVVVEEDPVFGTRVEKHYELVTFFVPLQVAAGIDVEKLAIDLKFHGQVCSEKGCRPLRDVTVPVDFAGFYRAEEN